MNFKARLQMFAKSVSVWFGIFLIIGCCIGFSINILLGIFSVSGRDKLEVRIFAPIMIGGAAVLAVIAHFLSAVISRRPEKKMRSGLDKIAAKSGIGREYIEALNLSYRGSIRTKVCSELALTAVVSGDFKRAKEQLDRVDAISLTDVTRSTGDFSDAGYYFSTAILYHESVKDYESMENIYAHVSQYTENLTSDFFTMTMLALCKMRFGSKEEAAEAAKTAESLIHLGIKSKMPLHKAICAGVLAEVYYYLGASDKAIDTITEAMGYKITDKFTSYIAERGREMKNDTLKTVQAAPVFGKKTPGLSDFE